MRVAIAGGHGKIALRLSRLLSERGDEVHSLIRNPGHAGDVKATGADAEGDDTFAVYVRAKGKADADVIASGLDYTILRPGSLTDEPGTGRVRVGEQVGRGQIPRDDVAALIVAALREDATSRKTFEAVSGETPIEEALGRL